MIKHLLFITLIALSSSCSSQTEQTDKARRVSQTEWKSLIAHEKEPLLVDVRTLVEFNQGHLEGALNIDFRSEDFLSKMLELDKEQTLYIYCHSGGRSGKALDMLSDKGFAGIYELEGGYSNWEP